MSRVAVIGIIVEDENSADLVNKILHDYRQYIIGRMGIPYRKEGINIISIAVDAPQEDISALSGKLGNIKGVKAKTAYSDIVTNEQ